MTKENIELLIKKSLKGCSKSFLILLDEIGKSITYYSNFFYIPGYEKDDLINFMHLTIFENLDTFDSSRGNFKSCMNKILRGQIIQLLQKEKKKIFKQFPANKFPSEFVSNRYSFSYEDKEEFEYLLSKLKLSKREKNVLDLYLKGNSISEISSFYSFNRANVSLTLCRIKQKVKKMKNKVFF